MPKREFEFEGLPKPGEPLIPAVHPDNAALLDDELHGRLERMKAKLTRRERRRLIARQRVLADQLRAGRWNQAIKIRWDCAQQYAEYKQKFITAETEQQRQDAALIGRHLARLGRLLNSVIQSMQAEYDEYEDIARRLRAHDDALKAEIEEAQNLKAFRREAIVWENQIRAVFRQSARLHHRWERDGKSYIEIPQIEHVIFKEDRVLYQIETSAQGVLERFTKRWHSALPYNVDITDLTCAETLANLSAACNRVVTVERSKAGTNLFYSISRLDSPDGIPEKVLYSKVIDWYPTRDHAKAPWFAGVGENRKVISYNFEDIPHMMIAGTTKSGKSNHLNQMIATLITMNTPDELRLILVDLKGGVEFGHFTGVKHLLRPMIKMPSDVLPALELLRGILEQRLKLLESVKAKNLWSYNERVPRGDRLARVVFIIDELATLMELDEVKAQMDKHLMVLASQGRAVGIHMVLCTQRTSADVVPGWFKANTGMMVSGKMPNHNASLVILDTITAVNLPNIRGRMVFSEGRSEVICQSPFISDDEIARAVAISQQYPDPDDSKFDVSYASPVKVFGENELIDVCITSLEGKLSATRIFDLLGPEVVTLRRARLLVEDVIERGLDLGYIEHAGKRYTLKKDKGRNSYILISEQSSERDSDEDTVEIDLLAQQEIT